MKYPSNIVCAAVSLITLSAISPAQEGKNTETPDLVARKYKPELDRLKADYEARLHAIQARMISDYEAAVKNSLGAKDSRPANALKAKLEALRAQSSTEFRIVGRWNVVHGTVAQIWTINKDHTFSFGNETSYGKWTYVNGKYILKHRTDWELDLTIADTLEGICTSGGPFERGETGATLRGTRTEP